MRERLANEAPARAAVIPKDGGRGVRRSHGRPGTIWSKQHIYSMPRSDARDRGGGRGVSVRYREIYPGLLGPQLQGGGA
jgi:hypothetical protein